MDSSESLSFTMDSTTDSIDVVGVFSSIKEQSNRQSLRKEPQPRRALLRETNNEIYDNQESTLDIRLPEPDKDQTGVVDTTLQPSALSLTSICPAESCPSSFIDSTSTKRPIISTSSFSPKNNLTEIRTDDDETIEAGPSTSSPAPKPQKRKKSVFFDTITVYHFNRSQGFTSVPTKGGSTLGMKSKHFLRRRISVDLYEEVKRRSRREILLKIKYEKRKREERLRLQQQRQLNERLRAEGSSNSSASNANTSDSDDNNDLAGEDDGIIDIDNIDDDDDDESYLDISDISDSELESDSYIFLQPISVKLRRSLLRASGIGRIDPGEKRECNRIRNSREKSGCRCVGQCLPEYCECSRLGVKCHVDQVSFPCGCVSSACKNPEGRTEFDVAHVRSHFVEKVINSQRQSTMESEQLNGETSDNNEQSTTTA